MQNVRDRRRAIADPLIRELSSTAVVAVSPDHPLLINAADLLVGEDGRMTAIYTPLGEELRRPSLLSMRLILSRLATPAHARHILVLEQEIEEKFVKFFARDFAAILLSDQSRDLLGIVRDREFIGSQRRVPDEIVSLAKRQFSDVMQVTRAVKTIRERRSEKATFDSGGQVSRRNASRMSSRVAEGRTAEVEFSDGRVSSSVIRQLINEQVQSGYSLDNGVPYPKPQSYYGLATVENLPEFPNDPDKLLRAAAFGGWAMISRDQKYLSEGLLERLAERRAKRGQ